MGLFDPTGGFGLAADLARLIQSPRVQYLGKSLKGMLPEMSGPFGVNTRSNAPRGASSNLGEVVGRLGGQLGTNVAGQLGNSGATQPQTQQQDPLMSLYQQLISQLQSPVNAPTGIDTADLMNQVKQAINPIYDQRAKAAQGRSDRARSDVQGMYGALSEDYKKLAPEQLAQAADAQKQVEQLYGQLRSNVEGSYSRVAKEQGDLFKSLGIEAALPDVLADQAAPVQEASQAASELEAQQSQRYMDMGQVDSTYYREGAPQAVARGNEISTDMLSQLQDYLNQNDAERTSGIQTGYLDQLGQAQTRLSQQQQQASTETGRRQEMLWQMLQGQLSSKQQTALTPDSFMAGLPQGVQQSLAGAFTQLQRSPEAVYGKTQDPRNPVPGTYVDTTPEWYMAQADKMLQNGQIDATTHQALLMYLQLTSKSM